ncbi:MAG: ATP-binding protein [Candidatus Thorarchaeota archaeon]
MVEVKYPNQLLTFTPGLFFVDELGRYWIQQVTIRLRRELCWVRVERGVSTAEVVSYLPPYIDSESEALSLQRFSAQKQDFFESDSTASHLTGLLEMRKPQIPENPIQGSFSWLVQELQLNNVSSFLLALALLRTFDAASGAIIASCQNNQQKTFPTFALLQRLWDYPEEVTDLMLNSHPLARYGIIRIGKPASDDNSSLYESTITIPFIIANQLLYPKGEPAPEFIPIGKLRGDSKGRSLLENVSSRILTTANESLRVVPIIKPLGESFQQFLSEISDFTNKTIVAYNGNPTDLLENGKLNSLLTYCWMKSFDLFLDSNMTWVLTKEGSIPYRLLFSSQSLPLSLYLGLDSKDLLKEIPKTLSSPVAEIPVSSYTERYDCWKDYLSDLNFSDEVLQELAQKFRFGKEKIESICNSVKNWKGSLHPSKLISSCRAEVRLDDIEFAKKIEPRFKQEELILPKKQSRQFHEILTGMKNLGKVYYNWGLENGWNEVGLSCLFAGPSGTGKTMAAEILARELGLPLYIIDLSQVINKYVGETEKNLKKLFDEAEISDTILFFDEADSLFGKRTAIKDAHDRYANITVSYLLDRMEKFKGLLILATNKKKNLDDAFTRRIRYIIDFPIPSEEERLRIWKQLIPITVDKSDIDIDFLAKQFPMNGGNIKSAVFNACLQSADSTKYPLISENYAISMKELIIAIKREFDKMNRPISLEKFGQYSKIISKMEDVRH